MRGDVNQQHAMPGPGEHETELSRCRGYAVSGRAADEQPSSARPGLEIQLVLQRTQAGRGARPELDEGRPAAPLQEAEPRDPGEHREARHRGGMRTVGEARRTED